MKITVVGATGLIGAQVVELLRAAGHHVKAASRSSGVDAVSGDGVGAAFEGADVVVDVLNSPTLEPGPALEFFTASATTLLAAAKKADVRHYVVLSIVGVGSIEADGYLHGKHLQEQLVADSGVPYTIVRATQFHEFTEGIAGSLVVDGQVHAPDALIQPVAAAEVAGVVARVATEAPHNAVLNFGGPEKMSFADLARAVFAAQGKNLPVIVDPQATYFGVPVQQNSLVTGDGAELGTTRLAEWLDR
ncbi:LysR family transcriptional regulator [Mycolicibacterium parafortuitum]|uniref:LysR family transcriptional regulator n=1 Tax=Mycolicibacterium parafortuitum TaxID=39692 RepID=A0A7I7U3P7_MYCPF|nr:NAD(P)H-binding protein [Mycolicibacterium parafortuitum]PQD98329.1 LysR family transcriptional regulator [Mycobacterium sp. EPG1]BBY76000.1 LysR family transcriptional regulator [Mycolicibacterium parafortuitum]